MQGDFHLHFVSKSQTFDVSFQEKAHASKDTVLLNGRNYALQGDSFKIAWLKAKLPELTKTGCSSDQLCKRLVQLGATGITATPKTHNVGMDSFSRRIPTPELPQVGKWMAKEATLPANRMKIADKYWSIHLDRFREIAKIEVQLEALKSKGNSELNPQITQFEERLAALKKPDAMFIDFLKGKSIKPEIIEKTLYMAVHNQDRDLFRYLFTDLSLADLQSIDSGERLNVLPIIPRSHSPVTLKEADIQNIRDYMRDSHFSGIVTISDGKNIRTITSDNIQNSDTPFAIHSVGKVFTGVLALRLIEEGIIQEKMLDEPIQLDREVTTALPPNVREQLAKTTLRQVMLHQGRYGDYLKKYEAAIEKALREGTAVPKIEKPEDFLQFADTELVQLGPSGETYSNLGLLLVGLSLQHLHNSNQSERLDYQEILNKFVLEPAGIRTFETHMPKNGCVNPEEKDKAPPHIVGGPAGGYWSTTADLLRMGEWLGKKCKNEQFMELMDKYGREFYGNGEISHGGSIESASAHFSHNLKNGMTIAIVSNTTGLGKASALSEIIQENVLAPDEETLQSLERANIYIDQLEDSEFFSGVVLVACGDQIVRQVATDKTGSGFNVDTPFVILSIGKLVTAVSVMQLTESHLQVISLDTPVYKLLRPEDYSFKDFDRVFLDDCINPGDLENLRQNIENNDAITVRHLLTHTSGIIEKRDHEGTEFDPQALAKKEWHYSNLGYLLLASIVKNVSGVAEFNDYIIQNVFQKAGMTSAIECATSEPKFKPHRFETSFPLGDHQETQEALPKAGGYGCLWMNAQDLFRFSRAFGRGELVRPETRDQMMQKYTTADRGLDQGLGFRVAVGNPAIIGHDGGGPGASAGLRVISGNPPITIISLSNYGRGEIASHQLTAVVKNEIPPIPYHVDRVIKEIYLDLKELKNPDSSAIEKLMNRLPIPDLAERKAILRDIAKTLSEENRPVFDLVVNMTRRDIQEALRSIKEPNVDIVRDIMGILPIDDREERIAIIREIAQSLEIENPVLYQLIIKEFEIR